MENSTHSFREANLVLQLIKEPQIKSKTAMSWSSRKKQEGYFLYRLFCPKGISLRFVLYLNVQCIEYAFRIYIRLHIKKHYFIHFCCLFSESSKAFSISLSQVWHSIKRPAICTTKHMTGFYMNCITKTGQFVEHA